MRDLVEYDVHDLVAEVSPATFFRYFPTNGSALISNVIDQVAVSALASQPADVSTA
jgi:hypothetical protein